MARLRASAQFAKGLWVQWHTVIPEPAGHTCQLMATPATGHGEWRGVPGFGSGKLVVSSKGWVKTMYAGGFADGDGRRKLGTPRLGMHFKGHLVVTLDNKKHKVCELVALAFLEPRPSIEHSLVHKNGDVRDNAVGNLVWENVYEGEVYGEWRSVPNIDPGKLRVSSNGWVRVRPRGKYRNELGRPTLGQKLASEYMGICIDRASYQVHRLVALAFIGPRPSELHTIDHIDRDPTNNRATNLRWASQKEQSANKGVPKRSYLCATEKEDQQDLVVDGETELWTTVTETLRVSTMGRVQRRHRTSTTKWMSKGTPPVNKNRSGYVTVAVGEKRPGLHQVVLLAFKGKSDDPLKTSVDHINNVRHDNRLCNLRWANKSQQATNTIRGKRKRATFPDL